MFIVSLTTIAALRTDGYSHAVNSVSGLGARGVPLALAFNVFGFVLPGLGVASLSYVLAQAGGRTRNVGVLLLAASGVALAAAGIFPIDVAHRTSLASVVHLIAATVSGLFWMLSLFWLGRLLKRIGLISWGSATPWFSLFILVEIIWAIAWQATPGWGQRIGFAGYFIWAAVTGSLLARSNAWL